MALLSVTLIVPLSKAIQLLEYDVCFRDSMEQCPFIEEKDVCLLKAIKVAIARNMQIDVFKLDCKPIVDVISLSSIPYNEFGDIIFSS